MTAAELLARLAQRPDKVAIRAGYAGYLEAKLARAEFDRALLLDAVELYFSEDAPPYDSVVQADRRAAENALRTIVTELRRAP